MERLSNETQVVDLTTKSLPDLRHVDEELLRRTMETVKKQIERPRTNLGSSGPPGRTD